MTFQKAILPPCPVCKTGELKTIESRTTDLSTRRRKKCSNCGHRLTTHEVSAEFFEEAKNNKIIIKDVISALGIKKLAESVEPVEIPCESCCHKVKSSGTGEWYCDLGFTEYDTDEAVGCSCYRLP
jgi:transcriptional regulator NrdR family protein